MANLFKTRFVPNADGTNSATAITNANTVFVHTYIGDDLTGDGTREFPFKSIYRAKLKNASNNIVFRGVVNEYFDARLIGDDINQTVISANFHPKFEGIRFSFDEQFISTYYAYNNCIQLKSDNFSFSSGSIYIQKYLMLPILKAAGNGDDSNFTVGSFDCKDFQINSNYPNSLLRNGLIIHSFNVTSKPPRLRYFVFPSSCLFKFNGVPLQMPLWTNDSAVNIQLLRNAYLAAGMDISKVNYMFYKDSFDNETCKIVFEQKNGGTHPNIFNRYNPDGTVSDYTLNPDPLNEALHASDLGGYVGCFSAAISANNWGSIINVSADGSDDVVAGQLLQSDFTFSHASGQTWNRIQSAVEKIEKPGKFKGLNCDTLDGTPWGDYFGKKQNLVSDVALNPTEALEANTRYKVANTADNSNYAAVIYKGGQYPPDFFFVTDATNLTFDLLNAGSGSVVRKVFAAPLESGEIIPFDDYTTPSAFPRFSAPFMGDVLMLFHKIGANINQPVLFSEVTNDKMAYYANWAVTNADQEFVTLASDTVNYYYKIPILTYYKKELNAHFDANYDQ